MKRKRLVLFGVGQVAQVALHYLNDVEGIEVEACLVDRSHLGSVTPIEGLPVHAFEDLVRLYPPNEFELFFPISYRNLNSIRRDRFLKAKALGYRFFSYVHPSVKVWKSVTIGENCMIFENNVVQPQTSIGDNVIVWSHCHIGHHVRVEPHVYITSGTVVCGSTVIGESSFLGAGSLIRDGINVGKRNLIGMGAILTQSTEEASMYIAGLNNRRLLNRPVEQVQI
jgi:sugar O-acyltransferase (sialic acid O-acetyltransferase NeuD family)